MEGAYMYCRYCGTKLPEACNYCGSCGNPTQLALNPYQPSHNVLMRSKPKPQRWPWVIGSIMVFLFFAVAVVMGYLYVKSLDSNQKEDVFTFSSETQEEFTFDTLDQVTIIGDSKLSPTVTEIFPTSGTVGQKVQIIGSNLLNEQVVMVTIGDVEMNLYGVYDDIIEVTLVVQNQVLLRSSMQII